jgi:hypothetical protein
MADPTEREEREHGDRLADLAGRRQTTILREFWDFVRINNKWWLVPIVSVLLLVAVFLILAGTGAAPLIYTLF